MKNKKLIIVVVCIVLSLFVVFFCSKFIYGAVHTDGIEDAAIDVSEYAEFLAHTGVPDEDINSLEHSVIKYIAEDLKAKAGSGNLSFLTEGEDFILSSQENGRFNSKIYAFKNGDEIYAYTVFEIKNIKKTALNTISIGFGGHFWPDEYGGLLWMKSGKNESRMQEVNKLTANQLTLSSGSFSGSQLKLRRGKIYVGCIYTHMTYGDDSDNRVFVQHTWE
mgnify:FL=1